MRRHINMRAVASVVFLCVVAAAVALLLNPMAAFSVKSDEDSVRSAANALNRALSQCYALEGSYPPDLAYLERKYGVMLSDRYHYYYEVFASNIRPTVEVIPKEGAW